MQMFQWPAAMVPTIIRAGRFPLADRDFATRYRSATHALHLHVYAGEMQLAGEAVSLRPGDLTLSPAGLPSAYHLDTPGHHWCIHFTPADAAGEIALPLRLSLAGGGTVVREQMAHVAALHARGQESLVARASAALSLQALLLWMAEQVAPAPRPCSAADRAAAFIDDHFHEPLTVPAIARAAGCSPAHLARAFRARHGVTVPHRLAERRVAHARYLLESTDLPIWRVAERVGIPDAQHFNKTVRRLLGASPSALRAAAAGPLVDPDR